MRFQNLDIFCRVIDNFGDIGVVYRFAREFLYSNPTIKIRVFLDDFNTFTSLNDTVDPSKCIQTIDSITYLKMNSLDHGFFENNETAEVIIEAFGCEIPDVYMEKAYYQSKLLLNLEYISAEDWVEEYHLQESLLPKGNLKKYFFMPGFTNATGGVIASSSTHTLIENNRFSSLSFINNTLASCKIMIKPDAESMIGTIFTYLRNFRNLFDSISSIRKHFFLLIFGQKSKEGIEHTLRDLGCSCEESNVIQYRNIHLIFLPFLAQRSYDLLLYHTDFNIVRGEDSLVRAILAGKPMIWNAYLQDNKYQKVKVEAFCKRMQPYFDDSMDFNKYLELMIDFNDVEKEDPKIKTNERYEYFFENLNKFEHSTKKMSYFLLNNCNLIQNISSFIKNY